LAEAEQLEVLGRRQPHGKAERIDPLEFTGCSIAYPFEDVPDGLLDGIGTYLRLVDYDYPGPLPDEDDSRSPDFNLEWHDGMNDGLWRDGDTLFSHLLISKDEVRRHWPASRWLPAFDPKQTVVDEMERRFRTGVGRDQLRPESRETAAWYKDEFPGQKSLAWETVRNHIRARFWELHPDGPRKSRRTTK
jgi:hypothetical protein